MPFPFSSKTRGKEERRALCKNDERNKKECGAANLEKLRVAELNKKARFISTLCARKKGPACCRYLMVPFFELTSTATQPLMRNGHAEASSTQMPLKKKKKKDTAVRLHTATQRGVFYLFSFRHSIKDASFVFNHNREKARKNERNKQTKKEEGCSLVKLRTTTEGNNNNKGDRVLSRKTQTCTHTRSLLRLRKWEKKRNQKQKQKGSKKSM